MLNNHIRGTGGKLQISLKVILFQQFPYSLVVVEFLFSITQSFYWNVFKGLLLSLDYGKPLPLCMCQAPLSSDERKPVYF